MVAAGGWSGCCFVDGVVRTTPIAGRRRCPWTQAEGGLGWSCAWDGLLDSKSRSHCAEERPGLGDGLMRTTTRRGGGGDAVGDCCCGAGWRWRWRWRSRWKRIGQSPRQQRQQRLLEGGGTSVWDTTGTGVLERGADQSPATQWLSWRVGNEGFIQASARRLFCRLDRDTRCKTEVRHGDWLVRKTAKLARE